MNFLERLNDRQREAAETLDGPLLIIAGAGSGKTRALTYRIANLIARGRAKPWQILAVTFTNKAAGEMQRRISDLLRVTSDEKMQGLDSRLRGNDTMPMIGTFHSVCGRILRKHFDRLGRSKDFVIYDTTDTLSLMKRIFKEQQIDDERMKPQVVLGIISKHKNVLRSPAMAQAEASRYFDKRVAELYALYQDRLVKNNAVDFDDMIMQVVRLFQEHPSVLEEYQERWRYLNVDEYQDTNHAQYFLMKLLAAKYRHICVIGDSDQSIYRFRGADIRNILEFERDYPEAKVIKLEQNYRSTQPILDVADAVIAHNKQRKDKKMWTDRKEGDLVQVWHVRSEQEEGEWVAQEIERLRQKPVGDVPQRRLGADMDPRLRGGEVSLNDFVILYRTNAQSRLLEEILLRYALPYRVVGGVKFYARREVKDLLAYLRIIHNLNDTESLLRIINVPPRRLGESTIQHLQAFALSRSLSLAEIFPHITMVSEINDGARATLGHFYSLVVKWQTASQTVGVADLLKTIVHDIRYEAYLKDGTEEGEMRYENILELISVATKYDGIEPRLALATFLEEVALVADVDSLTEANDEALTLMTLHSVKGLEYPYVFMVGCEENLFPHSRTLLDTEELEEERRLMYVGCTRAMKRLYLVAAQQRRLYGDFQVNPISRFIHDIPETLVEWKIASAESSRSTRAVTPSGIEQLDPQPSKITSISYSYEEQPKTHSFKDGDHIVHKTFGPGLVVGSVGDVIAIAFEDKKVGIKKFAATIAPIQKV